MTDVRERDVARILVGESKVIRDLRREIVRFGPTKLPILLQGPTGSGKELAARAVHGMSRRDGELIAFNVCALSEGMFEDALFGHVRGAFTGAAGDVPGYLAEANGGSVFLDEISGLSMASQAKLLRALETGVYRPIGATRDRVSDFRLLSASNEELTSLVRDRRFRLDLLHRIGGCVLTLPSLRDRREDIPMLVQHFLSDVGSGQTIDVSAIDRLQTHVWAGNIRELRHVVDRLVVVAQGDEIAIQHVDAILRPSSLLPDSMESDNSLHDRLVTTLQQAGWDTAVAADMLHVHRATVYRWMRRLRITSPVHIRPPSDGAMSRVPPQLRIS